MGLFDKIFGTYSQRELKRVTPIADKVMEKEAEMQIKAMEMAIVISKMLGEKNE